MVFPHYKGDSYKFHAAGREDIDVSYFFDRRSDMGTEYRIYIYLGSRNTDSGFG